MHTVLKKALGISDMKINLGNDKDYRTYGIGDMVEIDSREDPTIGKVIQIIDLPEYSHLHYVIEVPTPIEPMLYVRSGHYLEMRPHTPLPPKPPKPPVEYPSDWISVTLTSNFPNHPVVVTNRDWTLFEIAQYVNNDWYDFSVDPLEDYSLSQRDAIFFEVAYWLPISFPKVKND